MLEQANCENLTVWLTSLGLPMYHQQLVTNGWNNLQSVSKMKEGDLLSVGILDKRHLRTMIRAISALNVTIQKISSCYEHNYESILSSASTHSCSSSSSTVSQSQSSTFLSWKTPQKFFEIKEVLLWRKRAFLWMNKYVFSHLLVLLIFKLISVQNMKTIINMVSNFLKSVT